MTLGNFRSDSNTVLTDTANSADQAYYGIDDVSLIPVEPQGLPPNGDTVACANDSVRLSAVTDDTISDYSWNPSHGLSDSTASGPKASPDTTTTYTVTKRTCCDTTTAQATVTVGDTPTVDIAPESCLQVSDTLEVDPAISAGVQGQWTPPQGLSDPDSASTLAHPDSSRTYTLAVTDTGSGCTKRDSLRLQPLRYRPGDTAVCRGDSLKLGAPAHPNLAYEWTPDVQVEGPQSPDPVFHPDSGRSYLVTQASTCDTARRSFRLGVDGRPEAEAGEDRRIPRGESVRIGGEPEPNVQYKWSPQKGLSAPQGTPTEASPASTTDYLLRAQVDSSGCTARDTVRVEVYEWELYIPNVFAPGSEGDRENRVFRVHGGPFEDFRLQVFSRWGELVFETRDPSEAWKGRYKGEPVKGGVYSYQLRATLPGGEEVERSGTVTLLR